MVLQGFILLGNEWIDFGPFIDPENAFNWVASASDALGTHVMAWPFFAMEGAALLGEFQEPVPFKGMNPIQALASIDFGVGETRLPVNAFRSLAHAEEQDMRGGLSCRFCYGVHAPGFECKEPG